MEYAPSGKSDGVLELPLDEEGLDGVGPMPLGEDGEVFVFEVAGVEDFLRKV